MGVIAEFTRRWSSDKNRDWFFRVVADMMNISNKTLVFTETTASIRMDNMKNCCVKVSPIGCDTLFVMVYAHPISEWADRWMIFCDWLMDGNWGDEYAVYGEHALNIIQKNPEYVILTST